MTNNQNQSAPVVCILATISHLHLAVTAADSFVRHHPSGKVFILQIGGEKMTFPTRRNYLSILDLSDLDAEDELDSMRRRYSIFEFCNALKPYLLKYLLEKTDYTKICYFDSDLYVLGNMEKAVWEKLDDCSVMLTPHYLKVSKTTEEIFHRELATIIRGVYNGGFVGIRRDENARQFIDWWKEKVFRGCYKRPEEGMFVDQRWLDMIPGFDIGVEINRHPGLNAAFWNLSERKIFIVGDRYFVNEKPLLFFHFSGYSPEKPDVISNFYALKFSDFPHLREIFDDYAEKLTKTKSELNQQLMKQVLSENFSERFRQTNSETVVSVVITIDNDEQQIAQTIESVLKQTLPAEIIILDSGSTGNMREIIENYGEKVVLIEEKAAALNSVLKKTKGEFVIFLEAGDYFLFPDVLEDQICAFRNENCAVVMSGWRELRENDAKSSEHLAWLDIPAPTLKQWLRLFFIQPSAVMFRRSALLEIGGFDAELYPVEFLDAALRLTQKGFLSEWLKRVTVGCRRHDERLSNTIELRARAMKKLWQKFFQNKDLSSDIKNLEEKVRFDSLVWLANRFYQAGNFEAMKKTLLESLKHTKLNARGALVYWFCKFSRIAGKERSHFDAFDLINSKQWRELESLQFGKIREAENKAVFKKSAEIILNSQPPVVSDYAPKINLKHTLARFVGRHRSGWDFALRSLLPLHAESGIYFDGGSDATFDAANQTAPTDLTKGWVGVFHNPPEMPEWFAPTRTQKLILASEHFQNSLRHCYGIFCLSKSHRDWLAKQVSVPVVALLHPTETPQVKFSPERFFANPEKKVVQIGHWIRKLHSIHFLPTVLKRCAVHQNFDYVREIFQTEKQIYNFRICDSEVEILPFLSDCEYDELLAENLAYVELYDAAANNAVIECIVRNTPILINSLPSVREYLGEDYPFYFESRMQAAAKAEDSGLIAETHEYLKNLHIKKHLTAEYFLKSVAESEIYQKLSV